MPDSSTPGSAPRAGLSLYANLLDPNAGATVSKGPVIFKAPSSETVDEASAKKPQIDAGMLSSLEKFRIGF